ncbi:MAG: hypothetical protein E7446_02920 [Ruminococcaceae bacterium]|nr:hypothetical protein [Oscillospiraceae bacterium]
MDTEKLYDFLQSAENPLSIGEINAQPQFKNVPRSELAQGLQQLARENIAFRSVKEGKAYYSANPKDGVSQNPCQKNIANIAAAMNGALAGMANPEMKKAGEAFRALDQLLDVDNEVRGEMPQLTYTQGTVAKCQDYTIAIPDGFILEMGRDDRDFVAWLPAEDGSKELEEARITLFAGQLNGASTEDVDAHLKSPELLAAMVTSIQWRLKSQTDRFIGDSEMDDIPIVGQIGGVYLYNSQNYQIMLGMPQGFKQMRMLVTIPGTTREDYHQAVVDWIATMRSEKDFAKPEVLNSEKFLPLNEKNLKEWCSAADRVFEYHNAIKNGKIYARVEEFKYYQETTGTASATLLKKDIRAILQKELPKMEAAAEEAVAFVKRACAAEPTNRKLLKLQDKVIEKLDDSLNQTVNLDDATIKVPSPKTAGFKKDLEQPEIVAIKQQVRREEEERKEKERKEKAYKSALNDMASQKESVLVKAAEALKELGDYKEAPKKLEECNAKLEEIRKEKERKRLEAERAAEEKRRREEEERLRLEEEERQRKLAEEERRRLRKEKFKKAMIRTGIAIGAVVVLYLATLIVPAILRSSGTMVPEFSSENLTPMQADTKAALDDYGKLGSSKEFKAARVMLTDDLKEQLSGQVNVEHWDLSAVNSAVVFYIGPESETRPTKGFFDQWQFFGDEPKTIAVQEDWTAGVALLDEENNVLYSDTKKGGSESQVDDSIASKDLESLRKSIAKEELNKENYATKYAKQMGDFAAVVETKLAANPDYLYTLECQEDCNAAGRTAKYCIEYAEKCRTVQKLHNRLTLLSTPGATQTMELHQSNIENLLDRKVSILTSLYSVNTKLAKLDQTKAADVAPYISVVNTVSQQENYFFSEEVLRAALANSNATTYDTYLRQQKAHMMELVAVDQAMQAQTAAERSHLLDKTAIEVNGFYDYSEVLVSYMKAVLSREQYETDHAADLTAYETESAAAKEAAGANYENDIAYMKVQMKYESILKERDKRVTAEEKAKTKVEEMAAKIEEKLNNEAKAEEERLIEIAIRAEQAAVRDYLTRVDLPMDSEYKVEKGQWGVLHDDYALYENGYLY